MREHEIRARMMNATIVNVLAIFDPGKGDELVLLFPEGDAVSIKADRLRLSIVEAPKAGT